MVFTINMDSPICLIENRMEGKSMKFVVNPKAINILSKIHQPVVVVSIVGMYRTGKSYLMNRLAGAQKGFSLGSTIQSETKGIWMWCVPHPMYKDRALVLLDTEGLGDVEKGDRKNDSKIFTLAILLSSALVYNSMGTINQDALDKLKFVGEITELIKVRTGSIQDEEATFSRYFPIFVWAVRDFTLELKINGQTVSADDYLENALKLKIPERSSEDKEYNELRNRLRMYFGKRRCFVFDAPADSRKQLKDLEHLPDDRLNEDFVDQSALFCDYILKNAEVKRVDITVDVTGHRLGELAKLYTEAINSNVVCLEEVVVSLAEMENKIAIQEATKHYESRMITVELPTETLQQFLDQSSRFEDEARKVFLKRSIKDKDQKFLQEFMENITKKRLDFIFTNETKSREVCTALISKHSADFERALAEGQFSILGGHAKFLQSLKALKEEYIREERKGVKAEEVLQEYLISKQAAEIIIIQEDNALTQKQKEEEEIRNRKQMEEIKERLARLEEEEKNQKSSEEMTNLRKTVQQLQEMLVEERRIMNEKLEQVVKEKEMERNLYQMQEHREQAEKYDEQIGELQSLLTCAKTEPQDQLLEQFNAAPIVSQVLDFLKPVMTSALQHPPVCPPMGLPLCPPVCPPMGLPLCPPVCPPMGLPFCPPVCPPLGLPLCPPVCPPLGLPLCPPVCPPVACPPWCP